MRLIAINKNDFPQWKEMREEIYSSLNDKYHAIEMEQIAKSSEWYCQFIIDERNRILGFVEISLRNIVDGCLSSPVAYLEGLYLKPEHRSKGRGREIIKNILTWCNENGFSELATDAELTNIRAHNFYKAVGFQETDRVVEFRIEVNKT